MKGDRGMQRREAILDAIRNWPKIGMTMSDVVVAAFQRWPNLFCLPGGYGQYPCSATVRSCLCGESGLIGRGFVRLTAERYVLTLTGTAVTMEHSEPTEQTDLDVISKKMNQIQRGKSPEKVSDEILPICVNCGTMDGLIDGYCDRPACQKKHRSSSR